MDWMNNGDGSQGHRTMADVLSNLFDDEGKPTHTSREQEGVELSVARLFKDYQEFADIHPEVLLKHQDHVQYLLKGLERLSKHYQCLDASRPWLCYWICHSLRLLDHDIDEALKSRVCKFLAKCQRTDGGFAGGPGQLAHLATTYAAVNCICDLATEEAYSVIDRKSLLGFLQRMSNGDGSFTMHDGGEADARSVYCAASVASLTGLMKECGDIFNDSPQWIVKCQTYEGGIAGCPGGEAHGGYTFCGYAALIILGHPKLLDTDRLLRWAVNRQMRLEGGFQGRTNKLVDGCYSFWQGGIFPLLHSTLIKEHGGKTDIKSMEHHWLYSQSALQDYLLLCCQNSFGGLIDKPGKGPDYYHTCYCLSGLSSSQHSSTSVGSERNKLVPVHPAFNVVYDAAKAAFQYFRDVTVK